MIAAIAVFDPKPLHLARALLYKHDVWAGYNTKMDRFVGDESRHAADFIAKLREFALSDNAIRGMLFLCGMSLSCAGSEEEARRNREGLQFLYPFNSAERLDRRLGAIYDGKIYRVIEDFIFKLNVDIPFRAIRLEYETISVMKPQDHGYFPDVDKLDEGLGKINRLYFNFAEKLGAILDESGFNGQNSFLSGIFILNSIAGSDLSAAMEIGYVINACAPPVFRFFLDYPAKPLGDIRTFAPTGISYWGLASGVSPYFAETILWRFQHFLLYGAQKGVAGAEDLAPEEFYRHCLALCPQFLSTYRSELAGIPPNIFGEGAGLTWPEARSGFFLVSTFIDRNFSVAARDAVVSRVHAKLINACIISVLIEALCTEARSL